MTKVPLLILVELGLYIQHFALNQLSLVIFGKFIFFLHYQQNLTIHPSNSWLAHPVTFCCISCNNVKYRQVMIRENTTLSS